MRRAFRIPFTRRITDEVDEELAFHLAMREEQLVRSGMSVEDARREARRQFGDVDTVRSDVVTLDQQRERAMNRIRIISDISQDVAYATRTLRRNPGFTLVALATLALGIGANTAVFALVDAVLLRTLDVPAPNELVAIGDPTRVGGISEGDPQLVLAPYRVYRNVRAKVSSFNGLMAAGRAPRLFMTTGTQSEPESPRGRMVSDNYFSVLRVPAALGRTFGESEAGPVGSSPVAVISWDYWQQRFSADPAVLGRVVTINHVPVSIIGVAAQGFRGEAVGNAYDIWLPLNVQPAIMPNHDLIENTQGAWLLLMGRLKPGATIENARAELGQLLPRAHVEESNAPWYLKQAREIKPGDVLVSDGSKGFSRTRATYSAPLLTLMAGVGLLLLIVCANVANLLLARATTRTREMSLRAALGAGRWRVVRQLLTESTVLSLTGAAAGIVVGYWGSRMLLALASDGGSSVAIAVSMQGRVAAFAVGVSLLAVAIFGFAPAVITSRTSLADALRSSSRSLMGHAGRGVSPARMVIAAQVALSLVLLVGAGLLVRSMWALQSAELGLDRDHLIIADVDALSTGYVGPKFAPFVDQLQARLAQLPGVAAVSYSQNGIYSGSDSDSNADVEGYTPSSPRDSILFWDEVGPGYAAAIGARLIEGRDFLDTDRGPGATGILINQTAARQYFHGASALGKWIKLEGIQWRVMGVIADAQDHSIRLKPVRRAYTPYLNPIGLGPLRMIVRTKGQPAALGRAIRNAVLAQDPKLPILSLAPLPLVLRQSIAAERLVARLALGFGTLALVLAAVGLYGVMSYAISRRTSEIGVRVALGAQRGDVVRMIVTDAMKTVVIGVVVGVGITWYVTRFLEKQLFDVDPRDAWSIAVGVAVLLATGVLASLIPALRGASIPPVEALREG